MNYQESVGFVTSVSLGDCWLVTWCRSDRESHELTNLDFSNPGVTRTMSSTQLFKDRNYLAVIGDEVLVFDNYANTQDSVTGLLLAGIGHITQDQKKNFLIVDNSTPLRHGSKTDSG